LIAWMSPRTTQLLHQRGDLPCLAHVGTVVHQCSDLCREAGSASLSLRRFGDRLSGRLGSRQATTSCDLIQGTHAIAAETQGQR
jgi:hypothetical protein